MRVRRHARRTLRLTAGEIAALRWGHVDLAAGQIAIVQSAEQTRQGVRYKPPKCGRGRTVALVGHNRRGVAARIAWAKPKSF